MSGKTYEILFVFSTRQDNTSKLNEQVIRCQEIISRLRKYPNVNINFQMLYVLPRIPSFALRTVEIAQYAFEDEERANNLLDILGMLLDIPKSNQHLRFGTPDVAAWQFAKANKIHHVIGYSQTWVSLTNRIKNVKQLFVRPDGLTTRALDLNAKNLATDIAYHKQL